jgi:hypothetical protein
MTGSALRRRGFAETLRLICGLAVMAACGSDAPDSPTDDSRYTVALVSPQTLRVTDGLRQVPETLVFEVRDSKGELNAFLPIFRGETTGWLRGLGNQEWTRLRFSYTPDTSGRIRLLWQPSGSGTQTLALSSYADIPSVVRKTFTLSRPAVALKADTVVSSGVDAVCLMREGRVGCVGLGACQTCGTTESTSLALEQIRWLTFSSPPRDISSTVVGACALLSDGNTACWDGVGPDGSVRVDAGHPPFVDFRGSIGLTADGTVWKGVFGSETGGWYGFSNRTWLQIPSDSVITGLVTDHNALFACARTASNAVMCSLGRRVTPILPAPPFAVTPFRLLRSRVDSAVVRARGGYTDVEYLTPDTPLNRVILAGTPAGNVRFDEFTSSATAWFARPTADSSLITADSRQRACVPRLDATCDASRPWHSVSESGRSGGLVETGFRRICGVRDAVVCHTYLAGSRKMVRTVMTTDTIRLAP